jgi:cytidylate kinase
VTDDSRSDLSGSARRLVVALDGPSSSGKSTVGAEAASRLGYRFCDTGLLYRAVTWLALQRDVAPTDVVALVPLAAQITLVADSRGRMEQVLAAGQDVTAQIADPAVDRAVSDYSKVPELRAALMPRQRSMAAEGGIIMAGRDIGTVILPHADIKLYINASAEARAGRRATQRGATDEADAERILHDLRRRDSIDSSRETAPLRVAPDATVVDTDSIGFEETVCAVVETIRRAQGGSSGR